MSVCKRRLFSEIYPSKPYLTIFSYAKLLGASLGGTLWWIAGFIPNLLFQLGNLLYVSLVLHSLFPLILLASQTLHICSHAHNLLLLETQRPKKSASHQSSLGTEMTRSNKSSTILCCQQYKYLKGIRVFSNDIVLVQDYTHSAQTAMSSDHLYGIIL